MNFLRRLAVVIVLLVPMAARAQLIGIDFEVIEVSPEACMNASGYVDCENLEGPLAILFGEFPTAISFSFLFTTDIPESDVELFPTYPGAALYHGALVSARVTIGDYEFRIDWADPYNAIFYIEDAPTTSPFENLVMGYGQSVPPTLTGLNGDLEGVQFITYEELYLDLLSQNTDLFDGVDMPVPIPAAGWDTGTLWHLYWIRDPAEVEVRFYPYAPVNLTSLWTYAFPEPISINVKPGTTPNAINPTGKQKIPVAILTTDTFDATQVDWESVQFGPDRATETHRRAHIEDVDGDGDIDLLLHFNTLDTGITCGDTDVTLEGELFSGELIYSTDTIVTVNCG